MLANLSSYLRNHGAAPAPGASASAQPKSFTMRNKPIHSNRHLRVICIGAGASGIYMAYKLKHYFTDFTLDIYEKNPDIGGTWHENRYPGCACDTPAHIYTYTFEPKPDWSESYASSREIFTYFADFVEKYGLRQYISCDHEVVSAVWDKTEWVVSVLNKKDHTISEKRSDFLINASGVLNKWRWPAIPGLQSFQGQLLHSAAWDDSVDLSGKRVGLIGNGSSGLQILPEIQKIASHVVTFVRQPQWIHPFIDSEYQVFTDEQKRRFRDEPGVLLEMRRATETTLNKVLRLFLKDSSIQATAAAGAKKNMQNQLKPELAEKLVPDFPLGCRRLTPGVGYLETLALPNVTTICGSITKITPKGCVTDNGVETSLDVLICATGFDTTFKPAFPVVGRRKDADLATEWESEPRSYLGMAAHGYPNYFMFLGPNSPIANGPIILGIELEGEYIARFMNRWQKEDIGSFDPKREAVDDFMQQKDAFMPSSVWDGGCRSWYKDPRSGKVTAVWPGSTLHYMETLSDVRWDDFDVTYNGNRFAYLGNGISQIELDPNSDLAYYIRDKDDGVSLSRSSMSTLNVKETNY